MRSKENKWKRRHRLEEEQPRYCGRRRQEAGPLQEGLGGGGPCSSFCTPRSEHILLSVERKGF